MQIILKHKMIFKNNVSFQKSCAKYLSLIKHLLLTLYRERGWRPNLAKSPDYAIKYMVNESKFPMDEYEVKGYIEYHIFAGDWRNVYYLLHGNRISAHYAEIDYWQYRLNLTKGQNKNLNKKTSIYVKLIEEEIALMYKEAAEENNWRLIKLHKNSFDIRYTVTMRTKIIPTINYVINNTFSKYILGPIMRKQFGMDINESYEWF
jgi:hypothetical protein